MQTKYNFLKSKKVNHTKREYAVAAIDVTMALKDTILGKGILIILLNWLVD